MGGSQEGLPRCLVEQVALDCDPEYNQTTNDNHGSAVSHALQDRRINFAAVLDDRARTLHLSLCSLHLTANMGSSGRQR
jgi:hypothetical protein